MQINGHRTRFLKRSWYAASIAEFQRTSDNDILASLVKSSCFDVQQTQRDAWCLTFPLLSDALDGLQGRLYLEFVVPRMGHRIDAVVIVNGVALIIEFKIGASEYLHNDIDQAFDYAADLKYFHEGSHLLSVVPILVATAAKKQKSVLCGHPRVEGLYQTVCTNADSLGMTLRGVLDTVPGRGIDLDVWEDSRYCPTPTIIEAARALYAKHTVEEISRSDADESSLQRTSDRILEIIKRSRSRRQKSICFVTGVPGAGKTLVGLNIATKPIDENIQHVFLSGNGPLITILREALARDTIRRGAEQGRTIRKCEARSEVKAFVQNVHHFRDEYLKDEGEPVEHVVLFDEAQRAWNREQTALFMKRKRGRSDIDMSEPEFLISCMDRRQDWAVIICLVGGGQEINTGEAGIGAWIDAVVNSFSRWHLYISPSLTDSEYGAGQLLAEVENKPSVQCEYIDELHLGVSMRSFRAETVSDFVKKVLDCNVDAARGLLTTLRDRYPIVLTRDIEKAKAWLKTHACGSERYGIVVSSQAQRLKPLAIDVRAPVDPVKWFLEGKDDVRSSYYLEDVATEFHVQGLELDWVCVAWDGDFRYVNQDWKHFSFKGKKWERINKEERQMYLKNAYRVLLTRARQGMVICVPQGTESDPTRHPHHYDATYSYLRTIGLQEI